MKNERLTIDEAILHAKEAAEKQYLQGMLCHANPNDDELEKCVKCGREHEQLAKWLEELKQYRELEEQGLLLRLPCKVGDTIWVSDRDGKPREMILDEPDIRCHCAKEDNLCMALCDRKNTGVCAYRFANDGSDIGEKVFLTQSEAEEKLLTKM